jgi:hypothetical protein
MTTAKSIPMNNKLINILWIDDQYDILKDEANQAKLAGFRLNPFRSLNAGMQELETNYANYEAVLLDAKFYENEGDVAATESTDNAFRAKERILKLSGKKEFEIFVLSGQAKDPEAIDGSFHKSFSNFYQKGNAADNDRLWKDIAVAVDRQPLVQLRRKYCSVFAVCTDAYISDDLEAIIIPLLTDFEDGNLNVDHFNVIRKVVEKLGVAISGYNLVPSELDTINSIARFLCGDWSSKTKNSTSYRLQWNQFPLEVGKMLSSLVQSTQAGSHPDYLDRHIREMKTDYWVRASFFQLLAILEWFKPFVDSSPEIKYDRRYS